VPRREAADAVRYLVELFVVVALGGGVVVLARTATGAWRGHRATIERRHARWGVDPRTLPSGDRQLWLVREGEDDFLFETFRRDDYGHFDEDAWSRACYRAEEQAAEFDRLKGGNRR
jgi:hypothetical protein